jgi:hypothetical protein
MSNANHIQHTGAASSNPLLAIAAAYGDYTKKSFEDTKLFVEKLCGAKSLENAIEVQTEFAKTAYETFVTESQTIGVLYGDLAKAVLQAIRRLCGKDDPDKLISLPRGVRAQSPCSSRVFFGSSLNMAVEQ